MGGFALPAGGDNGRGNLYHGTITVYVILVAIVAATGGLIFGFDLGITGGVISMPDFQARFFPEALQNHGGGATNMFCKYNDHILQLFTSCAFLAAIVAAIASIFITRNCGRKLTMILGSSCFLVGTALQASAFSIVQLVIGRVIIGFGIGFGSQITPLYLTEMAPFQLRGAISILFQLAVTTGIFAAQGINLGTSKMGVPWNWRLSLALGAAPGLCFFLGSILLPETPNSLVERGHADKGRAVLQRVRGVKDVDVEMEDIQAAVETSSKLKNPFRTILRRRYRPQLTIAILLPFFQQCSGINSLNFYAPQLFEALQGSASSAALVTTVIMGSVHAGCTMLSMLVVDRIGRKPLFLQGGIHIVVCEVTAAFLIRAMFLGNDSTALVSGAIAAICIFVAGYSWSWGCLAWLVPFEVQPLETRTAGASICVVTNFTMAFIIAQSFLSMLCAMQWGIFLFFAGLMAVGTVFAVLFVPETKGVPIEEMEEVRIGQHWFWRGVVEGAERESPMLGDNPSSKADVELAGVNRHT